MDVVLSYAVCLIVSIILLAILVVFGNKKESAWYFLLFGTTVIVTFFYLLVSTASNPYVANLCNRITCLDGTFMMFFSFMCMCDICDIHIPKWFVVAVVVINIVMFALIIAPHPSFPYVISYEINTENGYTYLIREFGPFFYVYMGWVIVCMILPMVVVVYSFFKKKRVSYIYPILLGACQILAITLYIIEALLGLHVERLPYSFIITEMVILWILHRTALYNVEVMARHAISTDEQNGYVILDKNRKLKSYDAVAAKYFPELEKLYVDREIDEPFLRQEFGAWIAESEEHPVKPKMYERDGTDIKVTVRPFIDSRERMIGFFMEVSNDSDNQRSIRELKLLNKVQRELTVRADSAARSKGAFLSMMSHEIRTPINAILGMNAMIARDTDDPIIQEYSRDVKSSAEWLLALVNDILDYSKLDSGKMKVVENDYLLGKVLHDIDLLASPLINGKRLELKIRVADDVPSSFHGDETKIRQIIINLVSNAIKYTDAGIVRLVVDYIDGDLQIVVADTGRGIPKASIPILFDAFSRVNEAENVGIEGTGLGLAITHNFIELMGGTISVESEVGIGTTFTVRIPQKPIENILGESDEDGIGNDTTSTLPSEVEVLKLDGRRILVVDDTSMNLKLFSLFLNKTGVDLDLAGSGSEAIAKCNKNEYDLIFVDHMMSGMDGIETMNHIRNDKTSLNKEVSIIVATANSVMDGGEEYRSIGFTDYLCKPFSPVQLNQVIQKYL